MVLIYKPMVSFSNVNLLNYIQIKSHNELNCNKKMWEKISISRNECLTNTMISTTMKLLLTLNMKQSFKSILSLSSRKEKNIFFGLLFFIKKLPLKMCISYEIKVEISDQLELKNQNSFFPL